MRAATHLISAKSMHACDTQHLHNQHLLASESNPLQKGRRLNDDFGVPLTFVQVPSMSKTMPLIILPVELVALLLNSMPGRLVGGRQLWKHLKHRKSCEIHQLGYIRSFAYETSG